MERENLAGDAKGKGESGSNREAEVLRTNDAVLLSLAEPLLREAGVTTIIADQHISFETARGGSVAQAVLHNGTTYLLSTFGREVGIVVVFHSVPVNY